jgi:hypothetical protein
VLYDTGEVGGGAKHKQEGKFVIFLLPHCDFVGTLLEKFQLLQKGVPAAYCCDQVAAKDSV